MQDGGGLLFSLRSSPKINTMEDLHAFTVDFKSWLTFLFLSLSLSISFPYSTPVSRAPAARRRHWGTINDYCRDYYRRSGEQAPLELFGGQFLSVHVALCVQATPSIRATIISRISRVHAQPTHHAVYLRSFAFPLSLSLLLCFSFCLSLSLSLLSLFPQFILVSSARLFFISKILSIRANKLCSALNSQARIYGKKDKAIFGLDCQRERMDRRVITDSLTFAVGLLPVICAIGT